MADFFPLFWLILKQTFCQNGDEDEDFETNFVIYEANLINCLYCIVTLNYKFSGHALNFYIVNTASMWSVDWDIQRPVHNYSLIL